MKLWMQIKNFIRKVQIIVTEAEGFCAVTQDIIST
jgi:hypothetical protein